MMPTRYSIDLNLRDDVPKDAFKEKGAFSRRWPAASHHSPPLLLHAGRRKHVRAVLRKKFEERYAAGKNRWCVSARVAVVAVAAAGAHMFHRFFSSLRF
jgi:hypothetical protein